MCDVMCFHSTILLLHCNPRVELDQLILLKLLGTVTRTTDIPLDIRRRTQRRNEAMRKEGRAKVLFLSSQDMVYTLML